MNLLKEELFQLKICILYPLQWLTHIRNQSKENPVLSPSMARRPQSRTSGQTMPHPSLRLLGGYPLCMRSAQGRPALLPV